jgi:cation diffusion facilitator CzcD-associated flavoprotein CzcO
MSDVSAASVQTGATEHREVIVVGAGFGGIYAIHRFRNQGLDVLCLEAAPDVGGVWYHNAYPGARCDLLSIDYSFSFSEELQREWTWSQRYSPQTEILAYLRHVTDRFDLRRSMVFDTRVTGMTYDDGTNRWTLSTNSGKTYICRYVVLATGPLSAPKEPDFPGYRDFKGELFQASRWPHRPISFEGKRVAVIGTGSTGVQAITEIAKTAGHLEVFQRTPAFSAPAHNRPIDPKELAALKARYPEYRREMKSGFLGAWIYASGKNAADLTPEEQRAILDDFWKTGGTGYVSAFNDVLFNEEANKVVADYVRERIAELIKDPVLREKLTPRDYPIGTRRPCCDSGYFESFNRDNVSLVDLRETPIIRFVEKGIECTDGLHELDMIIVALGFDALTGAATAIDPVNGKGEHLNEAWKDGPRSYLGYGVAGFPNLFFVNGPLGLSAVGNVPLVAEHDVDWIGDCIGWLKANGKSRFEVTPEPQEAWSQEVAAIGARSLFMKAPSWFTGGNIPGKKRGMLVYLGGMSNFAARCKEVAEKGYEGFIAR